ncbi:hypothetical protein GF337_10345 [candidate division KSB1 bacterium]|nr:hypothetical protein [candidate division KSB1 bacterium]
MTGKERILRAIRLEQPDRVPVFCQLSIGYVLLNTGIAPSEFLFTNSGYIDGLIRAYSDCGFDAILINNYHDKNPANPQRIQRIEKTEAAEIIHWKDGRRTVCPFDDDPYEINVPEKPDIETFSPDALDPETVPPDHYFQPIIEIKQRVGGQMAVVGEIACPFSCFMNTFGFEQALTALLTEPKKVREILQRFTGMQLRNALKQASLGIDLLNISSPYAGNGFISGTHYQEFVLPHIKLIIDEMKLRDMPTMIHTCGSIMDRMDFMIETGVTGIECMDPPPLGDGKLAETKRKYGDRIFLKGNIDSVNVLLNGSIDQIRKNVIETMRAGAPGGGYILSTSCSVAPRVPQDNLKLLVEIACKYPGVSKIGKSEVPL